MYWRVSVLQLLAAKKAVRIPLAIESIDLFTTDTTNLIWGDTDLGRYNTESSPGWQGSRCEYLQSHHSMMTTRHCHCNCVYWLASRRRWGRRKWRRTSNQQYDSHHFTRLFVVISRYISICREWLLTDRLTILQKRARKNVSWPLSINTPAQPSAKLTRTSCTGYSTTRYSEYRIAESRTGIQQNEKWEAS